VEGHSSIIQRRRRRIMRQKIQSSACSILDTLNLKTLRQKMGFGHVVMQSREKLILALKTIISLDNGLRKMQRSISLINH
jgi:hypothetical protein